MTGEAVNERVMNAVFEPIVEETSVAETNTVLYCQTPPQCLLEKNSQI